MRWIGRRCNEDTEMSNSDCAGIHPGLSVPLSLPSGSTPMRCRIFDKPTAARHPTNASSLTLSEPFDTEEDILTLVESPPTPPDVLCGGDMATPKCNGPTIRCNIPDPFKGLLKTGSARPPSSLGSPGHATLRSLAPSWIK